MRPQSVLLLVLAGACGGPTWSYVAVHGPDGGRWYSISCRDDDMNCDVLAGRLCPNGYEASGRTGHVATEPDRAANAVEAMSAGMQHRPAARYSEAVYHGHMMIRCTGAPVPPAPPEPPRKCLSEGSCNTGQRCVFAADAGPFDKGVCK
jgi:hypothetical protein